MVLGLGVGKFIIILILAVFSIGVLINMAFTGWSCAITKNCRPFITQAGLIIASPQTNIASAVDEITNVQNLNITNGKLTNAYITNQQGVIIINIIVAALYIFIAFKIAMWFPAMRDLGTRIVVLALLIVVFGFLQSFIGLWLTGHFNTPYIGFIKLAEHPEILSDISNSTLEDFSKPGGIV